MSWLLGGMVLLGVLTAIFTIVALVGIMSRAPSGKRLNRTMQAGANAPATQVTQVSWMLGFPNSPFWKLIWGGLGIIAFCVAVLLIWSFWPVATHPTESKIPILPQPPQGTLRKNWSVFASDPFSWILLVAVLVGGIAAFVWGDRKKFGTFLLVTVLTLVVYGLYKYDEIDVGHRRGLLYLLAIAAAILVLAYATTFKEKLTFGILLGATFTMLGFSHLMPWREFAALRPSWPFGGSGTSLSRYTSTECAGTMEFAVLDSDWTPLPQGRSCRMIHQIIGDVEFSDQQGTYLAVGWVRNRGVLKARSPSGHATMQYAWCPLSSGTIPLAWGCVPKS